MRLGSLTWLMVLASVIALPTLSLGQSTADRDAVLAVNAEFYRAFRESDMPAMAAVWGRKEPIAVQHPATWRIDGRENVLASWAQILVAPPAIICELESVHRENERWAVICLEQLNPGSVRMINIFHQEDGAWKMIYHGPAPKPAVSS